MASKVIHRETWLRKGAFDRKLDGGQVHVRVSGLANGATDRSDAISDAVSNVGLFHPEDPTLPLLYATAEKSGATRAYVKLLYGDRDRKGGHQAIELAAYRPSWDQVLWYTKGTIASNGRPAQTSFTIRNYFGQTVFPVTTATTGNPADDPLPYFRPVAQIEITVPTVLTVNPIAQIEPLRGKLNSDAVTFDGFTFPIGTLLFHAYTVDKKETLTDIIYDTTYIFIARKETWVTEAPPTLSGTTWSMGAITAVEYPTAAFSGSAFPYHVP